MDRGFLGTGLIDAPAAALRGVGIPVQLYADVLADSPESIVLQAEDDVRRHETDIVIGFGGGSSIDVPKLISVLDGELTVGLPAKVTAATGIDAMVHAIEAYTTRHKKNALSDMLTREARSACLATSSLPARTARHARLADAA